MNRMNHTIKAKWVAALRSGKYKQGKQSLKIRAWMGAEDEFLHCCLGVLCEVAIQEGVELEVVEGHRGVVFGGQSAFLPEQVADWAGLDSIRPLVKDHYGNVQGLHSLNDSGKDFRYIADLIEEHL